MKSFSYTAFLLLFFAAGLLIVPESAHGEDDDAYRIQESVSPRRFRSRRYRRRASGNDGYYESSRRRKRVRRRRVRSERRLASYDDSRYRSRRSYYETDSYQDDEAQDWLARIGLVGGLSSSSSDASQGFNNNILLGVRGDLQYSYFGAELDFFYGIASQAQSQSAVFLGDSFTEDRSLSNIGGDLSLKAQVPIRLGSSAKLVPKIGAGYSLLQQKITVVSAGSNTTTTSVSGLHGLAGFDLYATAKLLFSADFALGFLGNASTTLEDNSGSQESSGAATFNRIRAGAYYEIASHFLLGAQYSRRQFSVDEVFGDSQNQFLGVLMYNF
ncbi:MAG: hypothetical protein H6617_01295 [Bdellovibrionaceae bacterium]|nr:hypothetical protein [Bdellovibrionales bacterium]MCB9253301.1 hypothetical protein [Pseudobdellovibrionaceae bacterium]